MPRHLTDYIVNCDINSGTITSQTDSVIVSGSSHSHELESFSLQGSTITIYNSLQINDIVWVLSYSNNQKYLVLGRVV